MRIGDVLDERYKVTKLLGSGAFGNVYSAESVQNGGHEFAVKEISESDMACEEVVRELELMHHFRRCPHIIRLFKVLPEASKTRLVLELLDIDLERWLETSRKVELRQAQLLSYQLLAGMYWMHEAKVVHRDIKRANILLHRDYQLKICDLGACKTEGENLKDGRIGAYTQRAPEILLGPAPYSAATDVWCVGVVLQHILCKVFDVAPLIDDSAMEYRAQEILPQYERVCGTPRWGTLDRIALCMDSTPDDTGLDYTWGEDLMDEDPQTWTDMMEYATYMRERRDRADEQAEEEAPPLDWHRYWPHEKKPSAQRVEAAELLSALLQFDPENRATCRKALGHQFFRSKEFTAEVEQLRVRVDLEEQHAPFEAAQQDSCHALRKVSSELLDDTHEDFYAMRKREAALMQLSPLVVGNQVMEARAKLTRQYGGYSDRRQYEALKRRTDSLEPVSGMRRSNTIGLGLASLFDDLKGLNRFESTENVLNASMDKRPRMNNTIKSRQHNSPLRSSAGTMPRSMSITLMALMSQSTTTDGPDTPDEIDVECINCTSMTGTDSVPSPERLRSKSTTPVAGPCPDDIAGVLAAVAAAVASRWIEGGKNGQEIFCLHISLARGQDLGVRWSTTGAPDGWWYARSVPEGSTGRKLGLRPGYRLCKAGNHLRVRTDETLREALRLAEGVGTRFWFSPPIRGYEFDEGLNLSPKLCGRRTGVSPLMKCRQFSDGSVISASPPIATPKTEGAATPQTQPCNEFPQFASLRI
eukprot:Hpha_TRINITY_DN16031_c4_g7::TRINITY_DN16031_c4_g7_i1::g.118273::m.118273